MAEIQEAGKQLIKASLVSWTESHGAESSVWDANQITHHRTGWTKGNRFMIRSGIHLHLLDDIVAWPKLVC